MAAGRSSKRVIYAALAGNLLVALTKFAAAAWTGSSAMLSEGVHSVVDTGNQALLLYGTHRARQPPDRDHPLGHGRELYFWSFFVALLIFSLGAGIAFYEGVTHLRHPTPISSPSVNYIVFGLSLLFEAGSWFVAFREFESSRVGDSGFLEDVTRSKDPTIFLVLFEDSAAVIGIAIAFAGTLGAELMNAPWLDGAASIAISMVLATTAIFLARESKGLLIGEAARQGVQNSILNTAREQAGIQQVGGLITVHLGPDQIVAAIELDFDDRKSAADVERAVAVLERRIKTRHPQVVALFVRPKCP